ncbi:MAG: hypothetical protein AAF438_08650 [Pseudomonadota bacterium]
MAPHRPTYSDGNDYAQDVKILLQEAWQAAHLAIDQAQTKQRRGFDKYTKNDNFAEGQTVLLYTPKIKQGRSRKLASPWTGPFELIEINVNHAYLQPSGQHLDRPMRVHANRLKAFEMPQEPATYATAEVDADIETTLAAAGSTQTPPEAPRPDRLNSTGSDDDSQSVELGFL